VAASIGRLALAASLALPWLTVAAHAQTKIFEMSSTTFKDGGMMPVKVGNSHANFPTDVNCVGENVSPQMSWINPPAAAKSFVLLMVDPQGHAGGGVNHWVAYGIPPDVTGFAEGEVSKPSSKYVGGKSRMGVGYYSGPCAPFNTQPRPYVFMLFATDFDPKELPPGLTKEEVTDRMAPDHGPRRDKGSAGMAGLFAPPPK
jgi:Raf kinase inhibitor-like YbhB/YbcL family protein